ncbi:MAG: IS3 family transposase, partial [Sphaerochaetaceae bacterium]
IGRTFRTLKYECIFLHDYATMTGLSNGLEGFVEFFNQERLRQGSDYQTPDEVYKSGCFPEREIDIQVA